MEVGKMITGSPLLHTEQTIEQSTTVRERSNNHEQEKAKLLNGEEELSKDQAQSMVDGINSFLIPANTSIRYELHDKLDRYYVTVVNQETDEVVKEIPAKKLLDVYASMAELLGFIVDEKI
ncbi:flagellar protein YvyC [Gracilibacillus boraciitolerans JCM 21714]|uniref:Flagellar protein YvyC n=1 Tax=Gracilibacillus boraciitolerans JCM 21714 TaxID=1298598 RepID=W4VPS6_9BACI|nr:flagellar protein FlaG [Gracilibacillus boraciitolerans]GAE95176.1 flagellar protein YvyC [Gracilibacillus boraciitolerans JCM 21714]